MYPAVIFAQTHNGFNLLLYQVLQHIVIVTLIHATEYQHYIAGHTFQCVPGRVDIGSLRVINKTDAGYFSNKLKPVLNVLKTRHTIPDDGVTQFEHFRDYTSSH